MNTLTTEVSMSKTFYAVCNVNGPISKEVNAGTVQEVFEAIGIHGQKWIDGCSCDVEDEYDIEGEGMSGDEFRGACEAVGLVFEDDSDLGEWEVWSFTAAATDISLDANN